MATNEVVMEAKCSYCGNNFDKRSSQTECSLKCKMLNRTEKTEGCWLWKGNVSQFGYGRVRVKNSPSLPAHRVMYELFKGEIKNNLNVCHSCDNRLCVNPDHLWLGTDKENHSDMVNKGRRKILKGAENNRAKLNEEDVVNIIRMFKTGIDRIELSRKFGVNRSTIDRILSRRNWKHVTTGKGD